MCDGSKQTSQHPFVHAGKEENELCINNNEFEDVFVGGCHCFQGSLKVSVCAMDVLHTSRARRSGFEANLVSAILVS